MIDQTTIGATILDLVIVAGVPMACDAVSCASVTVAGVPAARGRGVGTLVNYSDDISASMANLSDGSLCHSDGVVRYIMPSFFSQSYHGEGRITMDPTAGLANLQNQTIWAIKMWF